MAFKEILLQEKIKVENKIREFFDQYSKQGTFYNGFLYQFYSNLTAYLLRGGKRLRPVSLIIIYKGLGGINENIYDLSLCVEFLHNASLVHDDIIDHDLVRRGDPSFHAFYADWFNKNFKEFSNQADFGITMGILGGDLLINLGEEAILGSRFEPNKKVKAMAYYSRGYRELINGVTTESYLQNLPLDRVSENDYLNMTKGKTGALFEKSILIGASLADENETYKKELSEFATLLGQAFQIRDDILGVFGDPVKTGKSTEGDIREGKKTLLAIYANKNSKFTRLYGKENLTKEEIKTVKQILKETGALDKATKKALELAEKASKILKGIKLNKSSYEFFNELIRFVQSRFT
ncbi:MAG: polyprenyl synthetase family protein [Promethearchaeota archaeon]